MSPENPETKEISSRTSRFQTSYGVSAVIGFLFIAAMGYLVFAGGRWIYYRFSPPVTLAISGHLEAAISGSPEQYDLHVTGAVQRRGNPMEGRVLISVQRLWQGSPQTIETGLMGGKFELPQSMEFTFAHRDERLLITAEAWARELPNRPTKAEIYLNATAPWRYKRVIWGFCVGLAILFCVTFSWVFTGRGSPLKNRIAIVFSYCIMLLFLALPLSVTNFALVMARDEFQTMNETPVGIVVARPWSQSAKETEAPQWVLNIGGHPKKDAIGSASTPIAGQPVDLEGGIAVPFYVLVLAVIGGAINMARQVPKYHQEGELSVIAITPLRSAAQAVKGVFKPDAKAEKLPHAAAITPADNVQTSNDSEGSAWRKGLLDQYMYLISAPFLAIITYFLLAWVGVTGVPALVLVAFSVGLITEPVIQRIIDAAQSAFGKKGDEPAQGDGPSKGESVARVDTGKDNEQKEEQAAAGVAA